MQITKSNIQILDVFGGENDLLNLLPEDSTIEVDITNGKKEGNATVLSKLGIPVAKLNFKDDQLNGTCLLLNELGERVKEVTYRNGVAEGRYCEYNNNSISKLGILKNGKMLSELHKYSKNPDYYEEVMGSKVVYIGEFSEEDLKRCGKGQCFEYEGDCLKEVYACENGDMCGKMKKFDGDKMTEYNDNGEMIYQGEFRGDVRSGFVREGEGQAFEGGVVVYIGGWKGGMRDGVGRSYKDRMIHYKGQWKKDKPNGEGELMNEFEVKYKGEWKDGLIEVEKGIGYNYESETICGLYENGMKKYVGEMENGLPNGKGVYYDKKGVVMYEGEWKDGTLYLEGEVFDYVNEQLVKLDVIIKDYTYNFTHLSKLIRSLEIAEGACNNSKYGDLVLSGFDNLKKIIVNRSSMQTIKNLKICDCAVLEEMIVEVTTLGYVGAFRDVKDVTFTSTEIV